MRYVHELFGSQISILFILAVGIVVVFGGVFHLRTGNPKSYGYVCYSILGAGLALWFISATTDLNLIGDFTNTFATPAHAYEAPAGYDTPAPPPAPPIHRRRHAVKHHDLIGNLIRSLG